MKGTQENYVHEKEKRGGAKEILAHKYLWYTVNVVYLACKIINVFLKISRDHWTLYI